MLSLVTPAFNEAENLEPLYARIVETMRRLDTDWEWIVVDDQSRDGTFAVLERLARADRRVRGLRLARNSGSHVAITCGLHHARGAAAVMMAADLQDPPETIAAMLGLWRGGAQIVWAVRRSRPGSPREAGFASLYYWIMRHLVRMKEMPSQGADFFLADRAVLDAFARYRERHVSVLALLTSLGFRQEHIDYDKQPRARGRSGWTLARKVALVLDSIVAFSAFPVRLCSFAGIVLIVSGLVAAVAGAPATPALSPGLRLLLAGMVTLAGVQLLAMGVVGEYVWRTLDQARQRPVYLVERVAGETAAPAGARPS